MKTQLLFVSAMFLAWVCTAQPQPASSPAAAKEPVNYVLRLEWKDAKKNANYLQLVTTEGDFTLQTVLPGSSTRVNDADIPSPVSFNGTLTSAGPDKLKLKMFFGRSIPYVTGTTFGSGAGKSVSSYQQMQVGVNSTFVVTLDKPLLIQSDGNGDVYLLVKRQTE